MSNLTIKNRSNLFGNTGGSANSTSYSNSEIFLLSNTAISSNISDVESSTFTVTSNVPYSSLSLRSGVYGFPKNPQGNLKDSIYSLLNFQNFTIGSIGSLTGVDPGQDYNVDPFVLAYQPFISNFNRKDYIIEIEDSTKSFTEGERINQASANLTFHDIQVSDGVYGNTYTEKSFFVNSKLDINEADDFIYSFSGYEIGFNSNSDINEADDFISISNNQFEIGDFLRYNTSTGNTSVTGLSNNDTYFVAFSNTTGIKLSLTSSGSVINVQSSVNESGHNLRKYSNDLANNERVLYTTLNSNPISGLSNGSVYFVKDSNSIGISLSSTIGGSSIDITANAVGESDHYISTIPGYLPGDKVFSKSSRSFNSNTGVSSNYINLTDNIFDVGSEVVYVALDGNTSIVGLSNNQSYFVNFSNSTSISLSNSIGGNTINITASNTSESGHVIESLANAAVQSVYTSGSNSFVRVNNTENNFANGFNLNSYTNQQVNGQIQSISFSSTSSISQGIIKAGSNTSQLRVKRINFENTFKEGVEVSGESSGATANVISIVEDSESLPIGLNASIEANVTTANGQVSQLQVIDSGFGYSNSEIVEFTAEDGIRSGSAKVIIDGPGTGRGYYKSSKGFLSSDMYVQDGDYYQEYSYEVLSKISFDKYSDVFKSVMHTAGTKFFGSVLSIEEAEVKFSLDSIESQFELSFNASTDVDTVDDTIDISSTDTFVNGDIVEYRTMEGNTEITGLSNGSLYEIANTQGSLVQLYSNGIINIQAGTSENGHVLIKTEDRN